MFDPNNPGPMQSFRSAAAAAPNHAVSVVMASPVHGQAEIEAAMTIIELAARYRLRAIATPRAPYLVADQRCERRYPPQAFFT
jgi:hypothetical protein